MKASTCSRVRTVTAFGMPCSVRKISSPVTAAAYWYPVYVGLGSNMQMPERQVGDALERLAEIPGTRLVRASSLYRSAPLGGIEQPDFVNAVAAVHERIGLFDL